MGWERHVPADLRQRYEFHEKFHAAAILAADFPEEWTDLCDALREFSITLEMISEPGGSESEIPRRIATILRPRNWAPGKLRAELRLDGETVSQATHEVDHIKGKVGFDFEWNSKDQTFDRDLLAFAEFHRYGKIAVGVIVTRSLDLNSLFEQMGTRLNKHGETKTVKEKYGASTTHMGKLLSRLDSGRNGGCPILAVGIKREVVSDAPERPANLVKKAGRKRIRVDDL
jgi:CRISPR-associated protein Csd2